MSLVVGDRIIEHDGVCWVLADGRKPRKGGTRFSLINPSYYATLAQVAEALIERELAEAVTVASSLQELVHMVTQHLKGCIEREEA